MRNIAIVLSVLFVLVFAGIPVSLGAATPEEIRIQELQDTLNRLTQEQERIRNDLTATQGQRQTLQREINLLQGQIRLIANRIAATEGEIEITSTEIGTIEEDISETQKVIDHRRETIGRLIAVRDRHDREGVIVSFFRFANISDFFQEIQDAITVHSRLVGLISSLKEDQNELRDDQQTLEGKVSSLEILSQQQEQQKAGLDQVNYGKSKLLRDTKGQESAYQKQITEIEKKKEAFFKEMRELELKIIHGGLYIVHITAGNVAPAPIFNWPESGFRLTQGYGMTTYARRGAYGGAPHNGIDMAAGYGSPINAVGAGTIVANGSNSGWGNWLAIQHQNNMVSVYAHMSSLVPLRIGTVVTSGQTIGFEGSTGQATGSHLHLSVYTDFFTYINDRDGQLYFNYFDGSVRPQSYLPGV